jgi:hypothetical protein
MPGFKEREPQRVAQKKQRLAPVIEAAMKRRIDDAPPLPEGYTITPMARKVIEKQVGEEAIERFQQAQATGTMNSVMDLYAARRRS